MSNNIDFVSLASRFLNSYDKNRNSILEMKDKLLNLLYICFDNELSEIETGKKPPTNTLLVSLDAWSENEDYSRVTKLIDGLDKVGALEDFEKQYYLLFRFDQIAERDSYGDPKHYILRIKWDYKKYLKAMGKKNNLFESKKIYLLK